MEQHLGPQSDRHQLDEMSLSRHTRDLAREYGIDLSLDDTSLSDLLDGEEMLDLSRENFSLSKDSNREPISPSERLIEKTHENADTKPAYQRDSSHPLQRHSSHPSDPSLHRHEVPQKGNRPAIGLNDVVTFALVAAVTLTLPGKLHTTQAPDQTPTPETPGTLDKKTGGQSKTPTSNAAVVNVPPPAPQKKEYKDLKVGDVVVNPPVRQERYFIFSDSSQESDDTRSLILVENQKVKAIVPAKSGRPAKQDSSQSSRRNRVGQGDPAPNGLYTIGPRGSGQDREIGVYKGVRVFYDMYSPDQGSRKFLGLHIDTSWDGTMGCVGVREQDADLVFRFREAGADKILVHTS